MLSYQQGGGGGGGAGLCGLTVYPFECVGLSLYFVLLDDTKSGGLGSSALCLWFDSRLNI